MADMNQANAAAFAKRSALRTSQTSIGNCSSCMAPSLGFLGLGDSSRGQGPSPSSLPIQKALSTSGVANLAQRASHLILGKPKAVNGLGCCGSEVPAINGLGCDCDKTGVPHCDACKKKMGLGDFSFTSVLLGLLVLGGIGAGVAWKMGYLGKKASSARKNKRRKR